MKMFSATGWRVLLGYCVWVVSMCADVFNLKVMGSVIGTLAGLRLPLSGPQAISVWVVF